MATAKQVTVGPRWEYLQVVDDLGGHWRYGRRSSTQTSAPAHIQVKAGSPSLATGEDGRPLLRLDDEGLPETIIVHFDQPIPEQPVGEGSKAEAGSYEYELVG